MALSVCVGRVLTELSREDRDIIEQCDLNGMKQQDYAKAHGLTLAAVKSRLLRARQRMRDTLSANCKVQFDEEGTGRRLCPAQISCILFRVHSSPWCRAYMPIYRSPRT